MPAYSSHAFAEKVALVTDGENPVGRAVALQLALLGCYVIVGFSKTNENSKRALQELQSLGTLANTVEADISTVEGAKTLVAEVEKMFGRLDLLINTLKFRSDSTFEETIEDVWQKTVDGNLKSAFFVTQLVLPLMKPRPKPVIVNIGFSKEIETNIAFAAVQAGLIGFTKSLAKTLAPKFRVNCVIISEDSKKPVENLDAELFRAKTGVSEDDAARAVVYLLSSEAVGLNGQILTIR
ncbi:MAG TPA: SDR family NAD(P)-dependent oxidoreductase [Pyrinomonadaceae bacterium]|nr:SDR family NAD(P)-dependent oxidoreductase [Pyrinomonadaceae bacterium]